MKPVSIDEMVSKWFTEIYKILKLCLSLECGLIGLHEFPHDKNEYSLMKYDRIRLQEFTYEKPNFRIRKDLSTPLLSITMTSHLSPLLKTSSLAFGQSTCLFAVPSCLPHFFLA